MDTTHIIMLIYVLIGAPMLFCFGFILKTPRRYQEGDCENVHSIRMMLVELILWCVLVYFGFKFYFGV